MSDPETIRGSSMAASSQQLMRGLLGRLQGQLVVSCQAPPGHPLAEPPMISALCLCAAQGGAAGLRVDGPDGVQAARAVTELPVIGLRKAWGDVSLTGGRPAITPTLQDAKSLADAGADVIAVEGTKELHGADAATFIQRVKEQLRAATNGAAGRDRLLMADVSTVAEGVAAHEAGADLVGTTLSGYTTASGPKNGPDLKLVHELARQGVPTVAEGRISSPELALAAIEAGACFVVVGKSITDPLIRTAEFVSALQLGTRNPPAHARVERPASL